MRALFVQQDHVSPVGPVGAQLEARGYDVEEFLVVPEDRFHEPNVAAVFPDPRDFDVIVPMGAPWSVYDEPTIGAWILEELTFLRTAHEAGVPVLGICFGGQALASALGGGVERAPEAEVGWYEIDEPTSRTSSSPGRGSSGTTTGGSHPPARRWSRAPRWPQQAYTIGRSMGVQFHPELTPSSCRAGSTTAVRRTSRPTAWTPMRCSSTPSRRRRTPRPAAAGWSTGSSTRWPAAGGLSRACGPERLS